MVVVYRFDRSKVTVIFSSAHYIVGLSPLIVFIRDIIRCCKSHAPLTLLIVPVVTPVQAQANPTPQIIIRRSLITLLVPLWHNGTACENTCKPHNDLESDFNTVETPIELGALIALSYFSYHHASLYVCIILVKFCNPAAGLLLGEALTPTPTVIRVRTPSLYLHAVLNMYMYVFEYTGFTTRTKARVPRKYIFVWLLSLYASTAPYTIL